MATKKFTTTSPYAKAIPAPPKEDYLFEIYKNDLEMLDDRRSDPTVRVAIFGLGRAGTVHLTNFTTNPRTELLYIVDDLDSKWERLREYWKLDRVTFVTSKDADKVFKDPKVDAVIVSTPTMTHEGIVRRALAAGKAVFCEKPVAPDRARVLSCYEDADRNGRPLFCAFNRRFDPSYNNVRDRIRSGEIGHVHSVKLVAKDSPLPPIDYLKVSGGCFHDSMVHDIDLMTWLLGEYPTQVSVQASANIPEIAAIGDFDTVGVLFRFPSGTIGSIDFSRNSSYGYDQRVELFGPKGLISAANEQPVHCVGSLIEQQGLRGPPIWYTFASRFRLAYVRELDHFVDVVLGKAQLSILGKEILAVSKVATACERAARTGNSVEIEWAPGELPPTAFQAGTQRAS